MLCSWIWKKYKIQNIEKEIVIKEENIKKIVVDESIKTLGACVNPSLN